MGVQGSLQLGQSGEEAARQLSLREAVGRWRTSVRSGAVLSTRVCPHRTHSVQLVVGEWGKVLESLSEPAGDLARQMPGSGPRTGQGACGHQQCLCSCMKDLLPAPAQSVAPCWGPACTQEQVICRPQVPCWAGAVLLPSWPRWQLALQDGGGLGFARCRWGCPFLPRPRATPRRVSVAPLGDAPNKGRHRGDGVWLGMTGAPVRRTGDTGEDRKN